MQDPSQIHYANSLVINSNQPRHNTFFGIDVVATVFFCTSYCSCTCAHLCRSLFEALHVFDDCFYVLLWHTRVVAHVSSICICCNDFCLWVANRFCNVFIIGNDGYLHLSKLAGTTFSIFVVESIPLWIRRLSMTSHATILIPARMHRP